MENAQHIAAAWESIASLPFIAALLGGVVSADKPLPERRATVVSAFVGVLAGIVVGLGDWLLYQYGNPLFAVYLYMPSLVVALIAMYGGSVLSYRWLAGDPSVRTMTIPVPMPLDAGLLEKQETLRNRLRTLPHFQETLEGDLISLINGDRVFRCTYHAEPCLAVSMAARQTLMMIRLATLEGYVAYRRRSPSMSFPPPNSTENLWCHNLETIAYNADAAQ